MKKRMALLSIVLIVISSGLAIAQQSTNYDVEEHVFNAGGHPEGGNILTSAGFKVSIDSIGDSIAAPALASSSFHADAGFTVAYPPPGEALNFRFTDATTFTWNPEKSVGAYNVYRGSITALPGDFGECHQSQLAQATGSDSDIPAAGETFFYLVTAENRIDEEGTKGFTSSNVERSNASPCP